MTVHYLGSVEVARILGVAPATVRSYVAKGMLPEPAVIIGEGSKRANGWTEEQIIQWQDKRPGSGRWGERRPHADRV